MEWHFGHNCRHFIPVLLKCRTLVESYEARADLRSERLVDTPELLLYVGGTAEAALARIRSGEINAKRQKSGRLSFVVPGAWANDDCFLKASGGQCLYFEPHGGLRITCIDDIERLEPIHQNTALVPTQEEIELFEREVVKVLNVAEAGVE